MTCSKKKDHHLQAFRKQADSWRLCEALLLEHSHSGGSHHGGVDGAASSDGGDDDHHGNSRNPATSSPVDNILWFCLSVYEVCCSSRSVPYLPIYLSTYRHRTSLTPPTRDMVAGDDRAPMDAPVETRSSPNQGFPAPLPTGTRHYPQTIRAE